MIVYEMTENKITHRQFNILARIIHWFNRDARHYQITFLTIFLLYGRFGLNWEVDELNIAAAFTTCLVSQFLFATANGQDLRSLKSAFISALSLSLMLKTNQAWVMILASFISIASKYALCFMLSEKKKHFYNPTNFGIITTILLTGQAWISPGQWGSHGLLFLGIGILGLTVLLRVKRLDVAFAFFITFCILNYVRNVVVLGWSVDFFLHQLTSGTLLLFTFFMITDPVSTPSNLGARIVWGMLVAIVAFYLGTFEFVNGAPLWALFFISPTTIIFDKIARSAKHFNWLNAGAAPLKSSVIYSSLFKNHFYENKK